MQLMLAREEDSDNSSSTSSDDDVLEMMLLWTLLHLQKNWAAILIIWTFPKSILRICSGNFVQVSCSCVKFSHPNKQFSIREVASFLGTLVLSFPGV